MNQSKKSVGERQLYMPNHGETRVNPKKSRFTVHEERIGLDIVLGQYIEEDRSDVK